MKISVEVVRPGLELRHRTRTAIPQSRLCDEKADQRLGHRRPVQTEGQILLVFDDLRVVDQRVAVERQWNRIVEDPVAAPDRGLVASERSPGEAEARSDILLVGGSKRTR